jgi:hypothetical protein
LGGQKADTKRYLHVAGQTNTKLPVVANVIRLRWPAHAAGRKER